MSKVKVRIDLAPGCEKFTPEDGYQVRVGDYRILYRINDKDKKVFTIELGTVVESIAEKRTRRTKYNKKQSFVTLQSFRI